MEGTGCIWRVQTFLLNTVNKCRPSNQLDQLDLPRGYRAHQQPPLWICSRWSSSSHNQPMSRFFFGGERDADGSGGSKVWMPTSWWVTLRSFESHFKPMSLSGPEALPEHRRASEKKWLNRIFSVNLLLHQIAWIENDWDRFSSILWESEKDRTCDSVTWSPRPGQELLRTGSVISQFHNKL